MKPALPLLAFALLASAGCTGLAADSADFGDTVTVRYTIHDADNGTTLRPARSATFVLGSGASGLGQAFERHLRGAQAGENLTFTVEDDPSLAFRQTTTVARELPTIERHQQAPRNQFEGSLGPASVGRQLQLYGVYMAEVTAVTADRVNFTVSLARPPEQTDEFANVGATLVSTQDDDEIFGRLDPQVGVVFTVNPPTPTNPRTPLGLSPGTYRTAGATEDEIVYEMSASSSADLMGKALRFTVNVVRVVPAEGTDGPACDEGEDGERKDCNYAAGRSPYVNGDPATVVDHPVLPDEGEGDGHDDAH